MSRPNSRPAPCGPRRGRRTNDDLTALAPDVRTFVEALRAHVLEPLRGRGMNYRRLSELLTEEFGRGCSQTTVQRIGAGGKIPPREVLAHLLDLAHTYAGPLGRDRRSAVTDAYLPALRQGDPVLYRIYELQDELGRRRRGGERPRTGNSPPRSAIRHAGRSDTTAVTSARERGRHDTR
ncbi:hypothetical protein [Kitasatospora sp. NPDC059327]|uniref:hypothetical protein n=1 Tax=Kitasatospora sp. NPDC059327 TaxID=3346803 RepID=UPI0036C4B1A5